jgi:hypothetical protein
MGGAMFFDHYGVRVTVDLHRGKPVEGWLVGETALGLYVALDPEGENVRFVPSGKYSHIAYDHDAPRAAEGFAQIAKERIDAFVETAGKSLTRALDKLNYGRLRYLGNRFRDADNMPESEHPNDDLLRYLPLRQDYIQLLDELSDAGVLEVIVEKGDEIRDLVSPATMPAIDAEVVHPMRLRGIMENARKTNLVSLTRGGRQYVEQITSERVIAAIRQPAETVDRQKKRLPKYLRLIGASGKIVVGSSLTVANVSLGVMAGVVGALPTLGLGTVAAAVGIATSTYTGLNSACDALKDLASALDESDAPTESTSVPKRPSRKFRS